MVVLAPIPIAMVPMTSAANRRFRRMPRRARIRSNIEVMTEDFGLVLTHLYCIITGVKRDVTAECRHSMGNRLRGQPAPGEIAPSPSGFKSRVVAKGRLIMKGRIDRRHGVS